VVVTAVEEDRREEKGEEILETWRCLPTESIVG
jgi:hypothetical protein